MTSLYLAPNSLAAETRLRWDPRLQGPAESPAPSWAFVVSTQHSSRDVPLRWTAAIPGEAGHGPTARSNSRPPATLIGLENQDEANWLMAFFPPKNWFRNSPVVHFKVMGCEGRRLGNSREGSLFQSGERERERCWKPVSSLSFRTTWGGGAVEGGGGAGKCKRRR